MADTNGTSSLTLHGRVAIVTGGAGGIGSAVSKHLASLGARVAVAYFGDPAPVRELVVGINATHGADPPRALAVHADVSDAAQVRALFDVAAPAFGGELHILVTTAAVLDFSYPTLAETSEASYDAMVGTAGHLPVLPRGSEPDGSTATPMFYNGKTPEEAERCIAEAPLGRLGMPEDIAPLVGFLASNAGGWVNAQVLRCNGGTI
ncbi:hypothetical protein ACQ4PT_001213 [Festuca glaucescens]